MNLSLLLISDQSSFVPKLLLINSDTYFVWYQSTGSFFRDKSITLGSLIGVSNILELSRRSTRRRPTDTLRDQKNYKPRPWLFSLCSKLTTDAVNTNNMPSLGHFLEAERRAASICRRNHSPAIYGPNDFSPVLPVTNPNPLFVGDRVAPHASPSLSADGERRSNRELLEHGDGYGAPLLLSCMCGQLIKWCVFIEYTTLFQEKNVLRG